MIPWPQVLKKVVIADDEPSMRLLVHTAIESDDYKVIEAADENQAWSLIRKYTPSLVLLDLGDAGRERSRDPSID